jgi:hypothetical protein
MDCECYSSKGYSYYREISVYDLIYSKFIQNFHRLPLVKYKICLFANNALVGYKGGRVEYDLLKQMNINSCNIELLECPKYEQLLSKYDDKHTCCQYHINNTYHCSAHEVQMFAKYVNEVKG